MKRVIILPFDGYESGFKLLETIKSLIDLPDLANLLAFIKLNDGVHNIDFGGPDIIKSIRSILMAHKVSAGIFLDLKIYDVSATVENVLKKYAAPGITPEILTVSSQVSAETLLKLRVLLPQTKLAMVSMVTDISVDECQARFGQSPEVKIYNDLVNIRKAYQKLIKDKNLDITLEPFDLVVCSPQELNFLKKNLPADYNFIVPGIRDEWMKKKDEHQKRVTGARKALEAGATYLVMGAQLTKGNPEKEISAATSRRLTLEELAKVDAGLVVPGDPLATLRNCEGYYESPKDGDGKYIGPVVCYAKKYVGALSEHKNLVGFVYLNFAKAEPFPTVREYFADLISTEARMPGLGINKVLGAPMGGLLLAGDIGRSLKCPTIFAEKVVTVAAVKEKNVREESTLVIDRHEINPGDLIALVEDVTNNFSTTEQIKDLIESHGGKLVAILCAFNRSGKLEWEGIPVISACDVKLDQYKQEDPEVADIVAAGKIILKPKFQWPLLKEAMENK
ncbi:MAG: orotidine 5'-phosphate decarboxylase / HUMPS family protein [Patescibacteria group bacterium]|jgi:orotidine-5'-phosphate decarboxylase/adenine/guanine phosphoribosyltransferase-like PRPP-binding protein